MTCMFFLHEILPRFYFTILFKTCLHVYVDCCIFILFIAVGRGRICKDVLCCSDGEEFTMIFCVVEKGGIYRDFLCCWQGKDLKYVLCRGGREGFSKIFCYGVGRDFSVFYKHVIKLKIKTCI